MLQRFLFSFAFFTLGLVFIFQPLADVPGYKITEQKQSHKGTTCSLKLKYPDLTTVYTDQGKIIQPAFEARLLSCLYITVTKPAGIDAFPAVVYNDFKAFVDDMLQSGFPAQNWEVAVNAQYREGAAGILFIGIEVFAYLGGAHPSTTTTFWNYDLSAGKEIKVTDILKQGDTEALKQIGEKYFRTSKGIPDNEHLIDAGYFWDADAFALPENFGFSKQGLVFFYNQYEIAPYVTGTSEFTIPWDGLSALLNRSFKSK